MTVLSPTLLRQFGLERDPFRMPISDLNLTAGQQEGLDRLRVSLESATGVALVIGESGLGKSTILARIAATGNDRVKRVLFSGSEVRTDLQFLRGTLKAMGLLGSGRTGLELTTALDNHLGVQAESGLRTWLLIDDADHLGSSQLDLIRTLAQNQSLSIVLTGEPALAERIQRKQQLMRRVSMSHVLNPASRSDIESLIDHLFAIAGLPPDRQILAPGTIDGLYAAAGGNPGQTLQLLRSAMVEAGKQGLSEVGIGLLSNGRPNQSGGIADLQPPTLWEETGL